MPDRITVYNAALRVEAYRFRGVAQPFPAHFHDYYVVGCIERGQRRLICRGREAEADAGSLLLFRPGDSHACHSVGRAALDYRALNIPKAAVARLLDADGIELLDRAAAVVRDPAAAARFRALHAALMRRAPIRPDALAALLGALSAAARPPAAARGSKRRAAVEAACAFMERRCAEPIRLEHLCARTGTSRSTLLRAFAEEKCITPYRYLEALRLNAAMRLLAEGRAPADAANLAGFFDQSHLTRAFRRCIGCTPGAYRRGFFDAEHHKGGPYGT